MQNDNVTVCKKLRNSKIKKNINNETICYLLQKKKIN